MKFQLNPRLLLFFCLVGVALAIGAIVSMFYVDNVVNVSLYAYDLRFDYEWAVPYWTYLRLALSLLGCVVGLNVFSMIYILLSCRAGVLPRVSTVQRERVKPVVKEKEKKEKPAEEYVEVAAILPMVCSKCGKSFTQPLCMFDFKLGKPRLVSVCPYCNALLAVAGNSNTR